MKEYTDKELLDYLEDINKKGDYTGKCILRNSTTGRGWRLHETDKEDSSLTVREAIIKKIEEYIQTMKEDKK